MILADVRGQMKVVAIEWKAIRDPERKMKLRSVLSGFGCFCLFVFFVASFLLATVLFDCSVLVVLLKALAPLAHSLARHLELGGHAGPDPQGPVRPVPPDRAAAGPRRACLSVRAVRAVHAVR